MNVSGRPELRSGVTAKRHFDRLGFTLEGTSVAGVATWLAVPQWSLAIDCGTVPPQVVRCRVLALTHAHMDHAGGIGTWLAMRRINNLGRSTVLAPIEAVPALRAVVTTWESLHRHPFDWELIGLRPGERYALRRDLHLEALPADHVIPTLGWAITRTKRRLLRSLGSATGPEIQAIRAKGLSVTEATEELLLAVSGDTRATMAAEVPQLREAAVSCVETTFLDHHCSLSHARNSGHSHIDELRDIPWNNQVLVPYHISQRYHGALARQLVSERLAAISPEVWPLLPPPDPSDPSAP